MHEEVLINVTPQETRVAYLENGMLQEIFIERSKNKGLVGNIYLGAVVRVLPGMQAAFIDVGLDRTAFLHAKDLSPRQDSGSQIQAPCTESEITSQLTEGQRVLVQVIKDPLGGKGARLTGQISIPARNVVLLPGSEYIGISQRVQGDENRDRLLSMLKEQIASIDAPGGFILRTAGENATGDDIHSDLTFVLRAWERIVQKQKEASAPSLIHRDLALAMHTIRDLNWRNIEKVRIDSRETYDQVAGYVRELIPDAIHLIEHYPGGRPIFELYGTEDEIQKALQRKVPLKSGGYLIIDQTEAMTTIDVNTGSFVGNRNLEETIFRTNLEAAASLARQLRVRNLGGIIIIDTRPDLDIFTKNALHVADRVIIPVKDTASLENSRYIVDYVTEQGAGRKTARILPCLVDSRIHFKGPFKNALQLLRGYAINRGYRCLEGFIAKSPKVESLATNPEGKVFGTVIKFCAFSIATGMSALNASLSLRIGGIVSRTWAISSRMEGIISRVCST